MRSVTSRIKYCIVYLLCWIVYFQVARALFLIYNYRETDGINMLDIFNIFLHGSRLDLSFAAYVSALPFLIVAFFSPAKTKITKNVVGIYTLIVFPIINLLMFVDMALYEHWATRLDSSFLTYLNTPKLWLASSSTLFILGFILVWVLSSFLCLSWLKKINLRLVDQLMVGKWWEIPLFLIFSLLLVIPMRGGLQEIPVTVSTAFHTQHRFSNHAAINFAWHFMHDYTKRSDDVNPYVRLSEETIEQVLNATEIDSIARGFDASQWLNTPKPNVVLIIWESLTSKIVGLEKNGMEVTPRLNGLLKEGVYFDNFYANGARSDKGLISILSGYYPQPNKSIMKISNKSKKLPTLFKEFGANGYSTSFYYGGDMNFANLKSYLLEGGAHEIIDESNFEKSEGNSKWGAHDHVVFDRVISDLSKSSPYFKTIFTLSSHEPFEFPGQYRFGMATVDERFLSSHYYTDQSLGAFIDQMKSKGHWDNAIVIIVADHGHPLPRTDQIQVGPARFHIPLLVTGDAMTKKDTTISKYGSQVDLGYSLLSLLDMDSAKFVYGKHLFTNPTHGFANYIFTNGFGMMTPEAAAIYDYDVDEVIFSEGEKDDVDRILIRGKAITQSAYQDFLNK